ncbi:MAG: DUF1223 domain-containing protein [bacterium]
MRLLLLTLIMIVQSLSTLAQTDNKMVVLELFTSQGCSSCPSADDLLKETRDEETNVVALSYHVDYWNYIGWKDPFSNSSFTQKQREYATKFAASSIYTPQLVVNGQEHFVGSNERLLNERLAFYSKKTNINSIQISKIKNDGRDVSFKVLVDGDVNRKWLTANLVIKDRETSVSRGENRNRRLKNSNIVVRQQNFEIQDSIIEGSITIPEVVNETDELSLVVFIQDSKLAITGANQISLK